MNRRILEAVLSFVCALALVLLPASYSWAQSVNPQQDQTDRDTNQENQDVAQEPNMKQDESIQDDTDRDTDMREKPSSEPESMPDPDQKQPDPDQQQMGVTDSESKTTTTQDDESPQGLPATAGELPLLGLIGLLSLATAASVKLARAKR